MLKTGTSLVTSFAAEQTQEIIHGALVFLQQPLQMGGKEKHEKCIIQSQPVIRMHLYFVL